MPSLKRRLLITGGAPNLIEDALQARQLAETLNAELRKENSERRQAEEALRERKAWLTGQSEALEVALNGAPLETSLGVLVRTAIEQLGPDARAAFYLANTDGTSLHHVVGMSAAYAGCVDGFMIGAGSLACGLATHTGQPVLTSDVTNEPLWQPWLWLAERFDYRGCWSFPIHTSAGKFVGTFAVYSRQPREPTQRDLELASHLTRTAAIIISRHTEAEVRKQAEEALRGSERRLRELIEALPAAVYTTDAQGRITLFNQAAVEFSGRVPALGTDSWCVSWKLYWSDETPMPHDQCPMAIALKEGRAVRGVEAIAERPDGKRIWFEPYATPLRDSEGRVAGGVNMLVDISERKRAEKAMRQSEERLRLLNADLESRVLERTADLRRTIAERERLQDQLLQAQKMESVGTLASGVAHDFNNLLNIISGYAAMMRLDGKNPATVSEGAAVIEETVGRGATLVRQLMSLSRKSEPKFQLVRLNSTAGKLATLLKQTFSKTFVITLDVERGLPPVNGDENQLHQALLNLCVNARDAMPEGGRISLKTETVPGGEVRRRFPEAEADCYVSFSVSDNGSGMDDATQRRIFEPFFTTKPLGQGTGLGLAVVYGIVKNHNGFIEVKSELGQGTTFCIYLPIHKISKEQPSQTNGSGSAQRPVGHGETILFVDDEEKQLNVMRRFLESEGYKVVAC